MGVEEAMVARAEAEEQLSEGGVYRPIALNSKSFVPFKVNIRYFSTHPHVMFCLYLRLFTSNEWSFLSYICPRIPSTNSMEY